MRDIGDSIFEFCVAVLILKLLLSEQIELFVQLCRNAAKLLVSA